MIRYDEKSFHNNVKTNTFDIIEEYFVVILYNMNRSSRIVYSLPFLAAIISIIYKSRRFRFNMTNRNLVSSSRRFFFFRNCFHL